MKRINITIRQLEIFIAVAKAESYTKAAQEIHLTQPAVSMQVKQLEDQLGVALFERLGRSIYLTEAGNEVYHYARTILSQLDEMGSVLDNIKGLDQGMLRISVATTANYFAPILFSIFNKRFPGLTVSLDITNRQALLKQLGENEVDLVIMGQPPKDHDLEAEAFMKNPLVVIAPPDHPLAKQTKISLEVLANEKFLVRERGSGTRGAMERFFKKHQLHLHTGMEVSSLEAIKQSVAAGLGLGVVSLDAIQTELELGRLVTLDAIGFPISRHWYVVHRQGKRLTPFANAFKNFMIEEAPKILEKESVTIEH